MARSSDNNHLCITSLHMSQRHFWIDRVTTGHTEDLQVRVLTVTFIHLQTDHFTKKSSYSEASSKQGLA